mmetsp:Transcript_15147/g.59303  ORF Transcript_15147/g.59303 Transcript_15147/m.59303 type:complete len:242 (-) Transcript_15147:63-788(-)
MVGEVHIHFVDANWAFYGLERASNEGIARRPRHLGPLFLLCLCCCRRRSLFLLELGNEPLCRHVLLILPLKLGSLLFVGAKLGKINLPHFALFSDDRLLWGICNNPMHLLWLLLLLIPLLLPVIMVTINSRHVMGQWHLNSGGGRRRDGSLLCNLLLCLVVLFGGSLCLLCSILNRILGQCRPLPLHGLLVPHELSLLHPHRPLGHPRLLLIHHLQKLAKEHLCCHPQLANSRLLREDPFQ